MQYTLPLDNGFLRRQCPSCELEFKWFHTETGSDADAGSVEEFYCPYCGVSASPDQWFTVEQVEYINSLVANETASQLNKEMRQLARRSKRGQISFKVTKTFDIATFTTSDEPDDMVAVASPCHSVEPIKVDDRWREPLHCLICGSRFVLG